MSSQLDLVLRLTSAVVRNAVLSPTVTGALLYLLARGPAAIREPLLQRLGSDRNASRLISALKWMFALGLGAHVNRFLNDWALNKWLWSSDKTAWVWQQEVGVVTGGSSGFGALITKRLAAKGMKIIVLDVQPLPASLHDYANVKYIRCDISSASEVEAAARQVRAEHGAASVLVNNAGIGASRSILDTPPEALRRIFDVNLLSHWYLLQAFVPDMVRMKKGHVVAMASLASYIGAAGMADYCATKAGVLALHEALADELKKRYRSPQVKTTIVHPTFARTPLVESYVAKLEKSGVPVLEPHVVADAVVAQILSGRSGHLFVPGHLSGFSALRALPTWLVELSRGRSAKW